MTDQLALRFRGSDLERGDAPRLAGLFERTVRLALSHGWATHEELAREIGAKPASVERMLRYAREPAFGGYVVAKRRVPAADGLWEYRVLPPGSEIPPDALPAGRRS